MTWIDEEVYETVRLMANAGDKLITFPARSATSPIDTNDIYDGFTEKFIATNVSAHYANAFVNIYNGLLAEGVNREEIEHINLSWFIGTENKRNEQI